MSNHVFIDVYKRQSFSSAELGILNGSDLVTVKNVISTIITIADGQVICVDGYLDIGIVDTMKDLFVNFVGAVFFLSLIHISSSFALSYP